jgi:hypothetical protein
MAYIKYINEMAVEYEVPKAIWRDMNNMMLGIIHISHHLDLSQIAKMMRERGWTKEDFDKLKERDANMKLIIQDVMFISLCEEQDIKEEYCYAFLEYWNEF